VANNTSSLQQQENGAAERKDKKRQVLLALGLKNGTIAVLDYKKGELIYLFGDVEAGQTPHSGAVVDLASSTGGRLFSCSNDGNVREWNLLTGKLNRSLKTEKGVTRLAVDSDGTKLATANYSIKVWDISSEKVLKKFGGHPTPITDLQFSPDSNFLSSAANDRFVNVWSLTSEKEQATSGESNQSFATTV
jgi:WD40 repeat protein